MAILIPIKPCLLFILLLIPSASKIVSADPNSTSLHNSTVPGNSTVPDNSTRTLEDEIQCYCLPYGGLGFASHILTYYAIAILTTLHSPWRPWRRIKHSGFNYILAIGTLIA